MAVSAPLWNAFMQMIASQIQPGMDPRTKISEVSPRVVQQSTEPAVKATVSDSRGPAKVAELLLTGWPGEAAVLLQDALLRLLALVLSGRESSLVIARASTRHASP